jgi:hypothetical protein
VLIAPNDRIAVTRAIQRSKVLRCRVFRVGSKARPIGSSRTWLQRKGYNVTHRHNHIRSAIVPIFREHGTDVQEEVKVTDDLRMDLAIYQDNNREKWVDLTGFTTDSKSNLKKAVEELDNKTHTSKMARYSTEAERQNAEFTALPFNVHGGFGSHSASVFARFGATHFARAPSRRSLSSSKTARRHEAQERLAQPSPALSAGTSLVLLLCFHPSCFAHSSSERGLVECQRLCLNRRLQHHLLREVSRSITMGLGL